jgi:hypothetical protein
MVGVIGALARGSPSLKMTVAQRSLGGSPEIGS